MTWRIVRSAVSWAAAACQEGCTPAAVVVEAAAAVVAMAVAVLIQHMAAAMTIVTITGTMTTALDNWLAPAQQ
jgi:hypothetical protein